MLSRSILPNFRWLEAMHANAVKAPGVLVGIGYLALTVIALYPVLSVDVPPLVDYPNHLARIHILNSWEDDPDLQRNYVLNWSIGPNMAMDFLIPLLAKMFSIYDAGKIFVASTLLLIVGGTIALRRVVIGKVGLWPMVAFLLLYNHAFFWGFLNFLFSAGLALLAFSGWIALRGKPDLLRFVLFATVSVLLFFSHLFGLLIYGVLVFGYELGCVWRNRSLRAIPFTSYLVSGGQFLIPALLFLEWIGRNDSMEEAINRFGPLFAKFVALISPVHFGMPRVDFPVAILLGTAVILCMTRRWVTIENSLRFPVALLVIVAALMPNFLSGVWGTDFRLPAIVGCLLTACVCTEAKAVKPIRVFIVLSIALFCIRTGIITHQWRDLDSKFDEFRSAVHAIKPGSKLLVMEDKRDIPDGFPPLYGKMFWHLGALAVIERSVFYPTLFTGHTMVDAAPATAKIDSPVGTPVTRKRLSATMDASQASHALGHRFSRYVWFYWIGWRENFDYLLAIRFDNDAVPVSEGLEKAKSGSYFDLYEIVD